MLEPGQRPWTWLEVASWIDTEGAMTCGFRKNGRPFCAVQIAQKERAVLDSLCEFVREATGKRCSVYFAKAVNAHYAHWASKEAVEATIKETESYLRTVRRMNQYAKAKGILSLMMTEQEQRRLAAARGREAQRRKRLLNSTQVASRDSEWATGSTQLHVGEVLHTGPEDAPKGTSPR